MDPTYVDKVKKWVECDNIIIQHKEAMKDAQDQKRDLEESILKYVEDNKYDKLVINISDGHIKFGKRNITQPLSMKLLRNILQKYASQEESIDVDNIMDFISENLEVKPKTIMNREVK
jgi:chromosomal replication initiation ATPase DnaA